MLQDTVGCNINRKRRAQGMTIECLATGAQLDTAHVGRIVRGQHNATLATLRRIAETLSVALHELFNDGISADDYSVIQLFVRNNFPVCENQDEGCLFDSMGSVFMDKITINDVENGALAACNVQFSVHRDPNQIAISYGITAQYHYSTGNVVKTISDIGCDFRSITSFAAMLSAHRVSQYHFRSVVEDYVTRYGCVD